MAQCIGTQLMPDESLGRDLQIRYRSHLRQVAPAWRNLRYNASTSVKLFLFNLLLATFRTISVNDYTTIMEKLFLAY